MRGISSRIKTGNWLKRSIKSDMNTVSSPHLYLVPTPIGNLKDITLRAIEVLKSVDVILAEDTRTTGKLLKHLEIKRPLQSYHVFNEHKTIEGLLERLRKGEQ